VKLFKYNIFRISLTALESESDIKREIPAPLMEFHISRSARLAYQFEEALFQTTGNVILANFHAARVFAQRINEKRNVISFPEKAVRAGQVNAMGLIDEILHYVVYLYRKEKKKDIIREALNWLNVKIGEKRVKDALELFTEEFPPRSVYTGKKKATEYVQESTEGTPNSEIALEEMILLWLSNTNPAFSPFGELFDDDKLEKITAYKEIQASLYDFFQSQPFFGPDNENLIDMLRSPAVAQPYSLTGQLEYIRRKWGFMLGAFFYRLLRSLDLIHEEEKDRMFAPGIAQVYEFGPLEAEPERFSPDKDWMPRVVLIAKSTYVWLDQLSKKYQRSIHRLDQIPDEELDMLARWGFTGLWLIGLWQRSQASQRIKQLCGNPEAVASAYSLFNYKIADDLGGEEAFHNLKQRAWKRGIRMAGDMVPNHMGIDSPWVIEHPDWFVQLNYSPFPSYTYNGVNLSWDNRVGIYLEDHYYSRSDASVVFKRVDHHTGDVRFVYHGNDGTSMPWNDTAQLNYLNPEVREAVIQTILDVARKFPVIRFDAAMTLTKKHYQRLWYPEPGSGGDIPTRSEHGLTKSQFDSAMPEEFWREVVDRVAREVPDTLLLAEAFWLMEGYFVRSLGMHRVYNSAFMNMLKNEHNDKYRSSLKNILEYNPEILKRFVNFMNNPDEATAVAQFGNGDKYFGVCTMLVTMPGLPMFGHGQIEGFTEKYGMEYRKSYWNEQVDQDLVRRHEQEIFPLMRRRYLFANVHNFHLYDFYNEDGHVNENVFAYSNSFYDEYGLVLYNNKYERTSGWIKMSAAFVVSRGNGNEKTLEQTQLAQALRLHNDPRYFVIFREINSGLEFIRNSKSLHDQGLFVSLNGFQAQVFLEFRQVEDNIWHHYANLESYLNGRGVPSIEEALKETFLKPIHQNIRQIINADAMRKTAEKVLTRTTDKLPADIQESVSEKYRNVLHEIKNFTGGSGDVEKEVLVLKHQLKIVLSVNILHQKFECASPQKVKTILKSLARKFSGDEQSRFILLGWLFVHRLGAVVNPNAVAGESRAGLDEWLLTRILQDALYHLGFGAEEVQRATAIIKILTSHAQWWNLENEKKADPFKVIQNLLRDAEVQDYLQVNRYREVLWFNKESFNDLLKWLNIAAVTDALITWEEDRNKTCKEISQRYLLIEKFRRAEKDAGYQVEMLLDALKK
jgi:glycosidase